MTRQPVLAFDPSIVKTGYAFLTKTGKLKEYGVIRPKGDDLERLKQIFDRSRELIETLKPKAVAVEEQYLGFVKPKTYFNMESGIAYRSGGTNKFFSVHKLIMAAQSCVCAAFCNDVKIVKINPKKWQAWLGLAGMERVKLKKRSVELAREKAKDKSIPEDAAEAYHMACYIRAMI